MKRIIYFSLFFLTCVSVFSQNLTIDIDNILIEENADSGFHLWVKTPDDVKSILITESTADPKKKNAVYTLRSEEFNLINGNEKRILDGKVMVPNENNYFLIDSTYEEHEELGKAFHIFVPYIVQYGYPWARNGDIYISAGTFLNIRSFEKPFADYSGAFSDNPFKLNIVQLAVPPIEAVMEEVPPIEVVVEEVPLVEAVVGFVSTPFSPYRKYSLYGVNNGKTNRTTWVVGETIVLAP